MFNEINERCHKLVEAYKDVWKLGKARLKWKMMVSFESKFVDPLDLFPLATADSFKD